MGIIDKGKDFGFPIRNRDKVAPLKQFTQYTNFILPVEISQPVSLCEEAR